MANEELYNALREANKAGDAAGAAKLAEYIQNQQSSKLTAPAPAKEAQPAQDAAGFLGGSINKAIAGAAGGPVDLARMGIDAGKYVANKFGANIGPQTQPDFGGSQYFENKMKQGGLINQSAEPRNDTQRFVQNTIGALPILAGGRPTAAAGRGVAAAGDTALGNVAKVLPKVDPETQKLARTAHDMGFRLRPDQVYESQTGKLLGEASSHVPLSGSTTQANKAVFNQKLADLAGIDGKNLSRTNFNAAIAKHGGTIGDIMEKTNAPVTPEFIKSLGAVSEEAANFKNKDAQNAIKNTIQRLIDQTNGGVIPGKVAKSVHSELGKAMSATDNMEKRSALGEIQDLLHDHVQASMSGKDSAALDKARGHYYTLKTLEGLAAKTPGGEISPALLQQALINKVGKSQVAQGKAGELGTLADIGSKFLKEPRSSGTAERNMALGMLGTGGAALAGTAGAGAAAGSAAGVSALSNLYNRVGPKLTEKLIRKPPQ